MFSESNVINKLKGEISIGHNRYGTTGESALKMYNHCSQSSISGRGYCHNGIDKHTKIKETTYNQVFFQSTSDTEVVLHLLSTAKGDFLDRLVYSLQSINGAYSFILMTKNSLIA